MSLLFINSFDISKFVFTSSSFGGSGLGIVILFDETVSPP